MLDHQVLVLNRLWQAINVCSVRRAFALICQGHAQVVYADEGKNFRTHDFASWRDFSSREPETEMVKTIAFKIRVPRIIVLVFFDRLPKKELTTWENIVCSCIACNTRKGNRLAYQVQMQLIRKPGRPKWQPFVNITFTGLLHESWRHFVDLAYWNVELGD